MYLRTSYLLLLFCFFFLFCEQNTTHELSGKKQNLVLVYVDLLEIQQKLPPSDPAYLDSSRSIFKKHAISKSEYDQILTELNQKPEQWKLFYKDVLNEIDRREAARTPDPTLQDSASGTD